MELHAEQRRQELVNTITDALTDMMYARVYSDEFASSCANLIKKLRELEEKEKAPDPKWPGLQKKFDELKQKISRAKGGVVTL